MVARIATSTAYIDMLSSCGQGRYTQNGINLCALFYKFSACVCLALVGTMVELHFLRL
jgi:hypothetical protein